jgi:hypothetical protein
MSRLYREGRHHGFAASLITRGLTQELALHAGLPAHAPASSVADGLAARGREDLANGLRDVVRDAETVSGEGDLKHLASRAAVLRQRLHPSGPPARALAASTPEES